MQPLVFQQLFVRSIACIRGREERKADGPPHVFSQRRGFGLFAEEGHLVCCFVVIEVSGQGINDLVGVYV